MSSAGARRFRSFEERTIEALLKDEQQYIQRLKAIRTETGGYGDSVAPGDSIGSGPREAPGNSLQKRGDTMGGPISYAPVTVTIILDGSVNDNTIPIGANTEGYTGFIKLDAVDPITELHTLTGIFYPGQDIFIQGIIGKTVVIKDTGNIVTPAGDFNLVGNSIIKLIYDNDITKWILYTSGSGSGGGSTGGGGGVNWKLPARVASDLFATLTHDFTGDYVFIQKVIWNTLTDLAPGDRILLLEENPGQFRGLWGEVTDTTKDLGGIQYKVIRPSDFDTDSEVVSEIFVPVEEGDFKDTLWHLTTDNPITLGSPIPIGGTPQTWEQLQGEGDNLGNHKATEDLNIKSFDVFDVDRLAFMKSDEPGAEGSLRGSVDRPQIYISKAFGGNLFTFNNGSQPFVWSNVNVPSMQLDKTILRKQGVTPFQIFQMASGVVPNLPKQIISWNQYLALQQPGGTEFLYAHTLATAENFQLGQE